jgi:hypothetical protein
MTNKNGYNLRVILNDGSGTEKHFPSYEYAYGVLVRIYGMCGSRFAAADIADNDTGVIVYEWNKTQYETIVYLWDDEESFKAFGLEYADVIKTTGEDGDKLAMDIFHQKWMEWDEGRGAILEFHDGEMTSYDTFGDDDGKVYNMLIAKWEE